MKIQFLIACIICGLITSCTTKENTTPEQSTRSTPTEIPQLTQEEMDKGMEPLHRVIGLIYWYYEIENKYPETPESLVESYSNFTNVPYLKLDDYETLRFEHTPTNTMMVYWETKGTPLFSGEVLITPELFAQPTE